MRLIKRIQNLFCQVTELQTVTEIKDSLAEITVWDINGSAHQVHRALDGNIYRMIKIENKFNLSSSHWDRTPTLYLAAPNPYLANLERQRMQYEAYELSDIPNKINIDNYKIILDEIESLRKELKNLTKQYRDFDHKKFDLTVTINGSLYGFMKLDWSSLYESELDAKNAYNQSLIDKMKK